MDLRDASASKNTPTYPDTLKTMQEWLKFTHAALKQGGKVKDPLLKVLLKVLLI